MLVTFWDSLLDLRFFASTHQDGHLTAGLWSVGLPPGRTLVAHLSGGTTDILEVEEIAPGTLAIQRLGGSADLNAGQFIDRVGVAMELSFPAGPQLERLAQGAQAGDIDLPLAVKGAVISFSGPESQARRLLQKGCPRADLARAVERCIADSLSLALAASAERSSFQAVLVVGGVAANAFIRARLKEKLTGVRPGLDPLFAAASYLHRQRGRGCRAGRAEVQISGFRFIMLRAVPLKNADMILILTKDLEYSDVT